MTEASLAVERMTGALGAVVSGFDPRDADANFDGLRSLVHEYGVVVLPEVDLSEDEHLELGRRFGTPSIFPVARILGATEPTMTVLSDGPESPNAADRWHTDLTWVERPPAYALLHMEHPAAVGGDTLWATSVGAFEALAPQFRAFLRDLDCVHTNRGFAERVGQKAGAAREEILAGLERDHPPVVHPLVRVVPDTGREALLFARQFMSHIVGFSASESEAILGLLESHVADVRFQCRWRWSKGDLAIWDERSTLHRSAADHWPQVRVIRRLEIDGERPVSMGDLDA